MLGLEPKTYGLKGRCSIDVSDEAASTYEPSKTGEHQEQHQDLASGVILDEQLAEILRLVEALSDTERAKVLGFVQGLVSRTD